MSTSTTTTEAADRSGAPPRWPRWLFRGASVVTVVMLFDQAVFAGQFLAGSYGGLLTHRENATFAGIAEARLTWRRTPKILPTWCTACWSSLGPIPTRPGSSGRRPCKIVRTRFSGMTPTAVGSVHQVAIRVCSCA